MISWGKAGEGSWQKLGGPCETCGPDGCDHTHPPTGLEQSLEEMEFTRSACSAAQAGDLERVRRMIDRNPGCVHHDGAGNNSGYTPLHYAARGGHGAVVALLLQSGARVHARTAGGATALHRAAFAGQTQVCTQLLRAGAAPDAQDSDGDTALHKAAAQGHGNTVAALLKACPQAAAVRNRRGQQPIETT